MASARDRADGYRVLGAAKRWVAMLSIVGTAAFAGLAAKATQTHSSNQSSGGSPATSNTSDDNSSSSSNEGFGSGFSDDGSSFFGGGSAPSQSFSAPTASSGGS